MTLNDNTEITHTDELPDGKVKVYIERPTKNGEDGDFDSAVCYLPVFEWTDIVGFSTDEMIFFEKLMRNNARSIMMLARIGGI